MCAEGGAAAWEIRPQGLVTQGGGGWGSALTVGEQKALPGFHGGWGAGGGGMTGFGPAHQAELKASISQPITKKDSSVTGSRAQEARRY